MAIRFAPLHLYIAGRKQSASSDIQQGIGQVALDASTMQAGSYTYTLVVEGRKIDVKQMVLK